MPIPTPVDICHSKVRVCTSACGRGSEGSTSILLQSLYVCEESVVIEIIIRRDRYDWKVSIWDLASIGIAIFRRHRTMPFF